LEEKWKHWGWLRRWHVRCRKLGTNILNLILVLVMCGKIRLDIK
jgi:hypothetical protein